MASRRLLPLLDRFPAFPDPARGLGRRKRGRRRRVFGGAMAKLPSGLHVAGRRSKRTGRFV